MLNGHVEWMSKRVRVLLRLFWGSNLLMSLVGVAAIYPLAEMHLVSGRKLAKLPARELCEGVVFGSALIMLLIMGILYRRWTDPKRAKSIQASMRLIWIKVLRITHRPIEEPREEGGRGSKSAFLWAPRKPLFWILGKSMIVKSDIWLGSFLLV